jgi:hypothetical protein
MRPDSSPLPDAMLPEQVSNLSAWRLLVVRSERDAVE